MSAQHDIGPSSLIDHALGFSSISELGTATQPCQVPSNPSRVTSLLIEVAAADQKQ
jgi:hypothetical protein